MIKLFSIAEGDIDRAFETAYNPPPIAGAADEDAFTDEYWSAHGCVTQCLAAFGRENDYGEGDFTMNQDFGLSRSISVELSSKCLWKPAVIESLQRTLRELPESYRVFISHGLLDEPDLYLLIERDRAAGFCSDASVLSHFGEVA